MNLEEFKQRYKEDHMNFIKSWNFVRCDRGCVEIYSTNNIDNLLNTINDCLCANYSSIKDAYSHLGDYQAFFEIYSISDLKSFLKNYNETHDNVDIDITILE